MGVFRSDEIWGERERTPALYHRLDEPARLSLGMVASLQSPLSFRLTIHCSAPVTYTFNNPPTEAFSLFG